MAVWSPHLSIIILICVKEREREREREPEPKLSHDLHSFGSNSVVLVSAKLFRCISIWHQKFR